MALSEDQWFKKLKELVPRWVFEDQKFNEAIFRGMASMLEAGQIQYENHLKETYVDTADEKFLDVHAAERNVQRLEGDNINIYRQKIKRILNNSNCPSLKALVDSLLIRGESTFIENHAVNNFFDNEAFFNRNTIDADVTYNAFTILIDFQIPEPSGFFDREAFSDREFVYGSSESLDSVFRNVIETVNKNKAFGTVYRLIERAN